MWDLQKAKWDIIQHHGTGRYWDKRMKSAEMKDVVKEVQDYINGGNNGV